MHKHQLSNGRWSNSSQDSKVTAGNAKHSFAAAVTIRSSSTDSTLSSRTPKRAPACKAKHAVCTALSYVIPLALLMSDCLCSHHLSELSECWFLPTHTNKLVGVVCSCCMAGKLCSDLSHIKKAPPVNSNYLCLATGPATAAPQQTLKNEAALQAMIYDAHDTTIARRPLNRAAHAKPTCALWAEVLEPCPLQLPITKWSITSG